MVASHPPVALALLSLTAFEGAPLGTLRGSTLRYVALQELFKLERVYLAIQVRSLRKQEGHRL
jgi:hypothetical protein